MIWCFFINSQLYKCVDKYNISHRLKLNYQVSKGEPTQDERAYQLMQFSAFRQTIIKPKKLWVTPANTSHSRGSLGSSSPTVLQQNFWGKPNQAWPKKTKLQGIDLCHVFFLRLFTEILYCRILICVNGFQSVFLQWPVFTVLI